MADGVWSDKSLAFASGAMGKHILKVQAPYKQQGFIVASDNCSWFKSWCYVLPTPHAVS